MTTWAEIEKSQILLNPRMADAQKEFIYKNIPVRDFPDHFWIASSGSTAKSAFDHKFAALSKKAVLASAAAVNRHLQASSKDVWLSSLPSFHVGGLGILARAYLAGTHVVSLEKWDPEQFCDVLEHVGVTLTSLVPAQVFDLVAKKSTPSKRLRGVIVGGGAISPTLLHEAVALGWPLLPSYGLTECSSQVATAIDEKGLRVLDHVEVKITEGRIAIKSESLLSAYAFLSESGASIEDPKVDGWFLTQDCGELSNGYLTMLGRQDDFIKIGGESVMMSRLNGLFENARMHAQIDFDAAIFAMEDERLGSVVNLAVTSEKFQKLVDAYNALVLPFERVRKVHVIDRIPRSALNKLLVGQLKAVLRS